MRRFSTLAGVLALSLLLLGPLTGCSKNQEKKQEPAGKTSERPRPRRARAKLSWSMWNGPVKWPAPMW